MRNALWGFLLLLSVGFLPTALASSELVQIVAFRWNEQAEKLELFSLGSGTAIESNTIITSKHVVLDKEGKKADFLLLCPAQAKSTRPVKCDIPAGVTRVHETFDAALVRPLSRDVFLPKVGVTTRLSRKKDNIRIYGFPIPVKGFQNFGSRNTYERIKAWEKSGGTLVVGGDKVTITRGKIQNIARRESTGGIYYVTDSKVNFGNSGGAAFDEKRMFIGIPALRDKEYNALILAYPQLHNWVQRNKRKVPVVSKDVLGFYETRLRKPKILSNRVFWMKRRRLRSLQNSVLGRFAMEAFTKKRSYPKQIYERRPLRNILGDRRVRRLRNFYFRSRQ